MTAIRSDRSASPWASVTTARWFPSSPTPTTKTAGIPGQVIKLVSECDFVVLGDSWAQVLERYAALAEADELEWFSESRVVRFDWARFLA